VKALHFVCRYTTKATHTEQNPSTRSDQLKRSVTLAEQSLAIFPTAEAYHHLATLYTRPGTDHSLDRAEEAVAKAVELDPSEVRSWHLLGLVLTAKGEGKKARGVLEVAAAVAESGMGGASGPGEAGAGPESTVDGVRSKDYAPTNSNGNTTHTSEVDGLPPSTPVSHSRAASSSGDTSEEEKALLPFDALRIPHASLLLDPSPSAPPRSASERLADATQVRMTQLVLVEQIEGGENVGEGWRDVFGWFAAKSTFVSGRMGAGGTGTSVNGGLGMSSSKAGNHMGTLIQGLISQREQHRVIEAIARLKLACLEAHHERAWMEAQMFGNRWSLQHCLPYRSALRLLLQQARTSLIIA
jgi:hypothetical protein